MTSKRPSISDKNINFDKDYDTLFSSKPTDKKDDGKDKTEEKEVRLRGIDRIRNYYKKNKRIKQFSIYLPDEIQKKIKAKASEDDKSVSDIIREVMMDNYLSEDDIRNAYNKAYDKRHPEESTKDV